MANKQDIITAIKNLDLFLKIPDLKGAIPKLNTNGSPFVFAGGFNMVFQIVHETKKWAFRVWHVPMGENKERYLAISKYLTNSNLPYFADFIYDENGLLVNGELTDTIRMEWLEGILLKDYIEKHLNDKSKLETLANNFLEMTKTLREAKISHGDLQEGNILVDESGKIRLVDYDSICIPEIEGQKELVTGLKGYQHPSRFKNSKASLKADYFSELIIYISILSIAFKPSLWAKYKVKDTQHLLFSETDFENIEYSKICADLSGINSAIDYLLSILKEYLSTLQYLDIKPLTDYLLPPEVQLFEINKEVVLKGVEVEFSWGVKNALGVRIDPDIGKVGKEGSITIIPKKQVYTLICEGFTETIRRDRKIRILPLPKVKVFKPSKFKLVRGENTELAWEVEHIHAVNLLINGKREKVAPIGKINVKPNAHTTYVLELTALDGKTKSKHTTQVEVFDKGVIKKFTPDRHFIIPVIPVTLSWEVKNAKRVTLEGFGDFKQIDNIEVRPAKDTLYTLIVEDEFRVFKEHVQVRIIPTPSIQSIRVPVPIFNDAFPIHLSAPHFPKLSLSPIEINTGINLDTRPIKLNFLYSFESSLAKLNLSKRPLPHLFFNINRVLLAFSSLKQKLNRKKLTT